MMKYAHFCLTKNIWQHMADAEVKQPACITLCMCKEKLVINRGTELD